MEYLTTGKVINVRGLQGEMKILSTTDFANKRYQKGKKVYLCHPISLEQQAVTVQAYQQIGGFDYIRFVEITTVEQADSYRGYLVQILLKEAGKLPKDVYYHYQLVGCQVFDSQNNLVGEVIEIVDNGAQKLLRVKTDQQTRLIPFLQPFLRHIDIENKIIYLEHWEGLL